MRRWGVVLRIASRDARQSLGRTLAAVILISLPIIIAIAAKNMIIAEIAPYKIVAFVAIDPIVAITAIKVVIADATINMIDAGHGIRISP